MQSKQIDFSVNFGGLLNLFSVWKTKFGIGHNASQKFFSLSSKENIIETVSSFVIDPNTTIDCEIGKIFMRLILWSLPNETIEEYKSRNNINNIFDPIFPSFLENNHPYFYEYLVINGFPGISLNVLDDLEDIKYMETYFYPPELYSYLISFQGIDHMKGIQFPGIHCIYTEREWFYFDTKGIKRTKNWKDIVQEIQSSCFDISWRNNYIITLNPEDTFIVFK